MKKTNLPLVMLAMLSIIFFSTISPVYAQDIAQLMAEKYSLQIDEKTFEISYGFKGSLEVDVSELEIDIPRASNMILNKEKKSLEIIFEDHEYAGPMWVRLPVELISAEGGKFQVFIDDVIKPFELTYYTDGISVGYFIPEGTQKVEIVGTSVIPEFSTIAVFVLGVGIISIIILTQKTHLIKNEF